MKEPELTPELVLHAYAAGIFPMAESRTDDELFWVDPEMRGILPLDAFHVPKSLRKTVRQGVFEIRADTVFDAVIHACAAHGEGRGETWINDEIIRLFGELHRQGHAHSIECFAAGELVGGLYGVSLAGAFFGESMFSRKTDASKVALVHLAARLRHGGYQILDTQFVTDHLKAFGAIDIPRTEYHRRLARALGADAVFYSELSPEESGAMVEEFLQSTTQTS